MESNRVRLGIAAVGFVLVVIVIIILVAVLGRDLPAAGAPTLPPVVQTATGPTATPEGAGPAALPGSAGGASLAVSPPAAAPGTQVNVTGAGFPPDSPITLYIGPAQAGAPAQEFDQTTSDAQGVFNYVLVVPDTYPDGAAIAGTQIAILASSAGGAASAVAMLDTAPLIGLEGPTPLPGTADADLGPTATYTNEELGISIGYPAAWTEVPNEIGRFMGADGYFSVQAAGEGMTLEQACAAFLDDPALPYGAAPEMSDLIIAGQPACLIMPSDDAVGGVNAAAVLIVTYPAPVTIAGVTYNVFVLTADQGHILALGETLVFLPVV